MTEVEEPFRYSYPCGCAIMWTKKYGLQNTSICDRHVILQPPKE